jgi:hypothetical protein
MIFRLLVLFDDEAFMFFLSKKLPEQKVEKNILWFIKNFIWIISLPFYFYFIMPPESISTGKLIFNYKDLLACVILI